MSDNENENKVQGEPMYIAFHLGKEIRHRSILEMRANLEKKSREEARRLSRQIAIPRISCVK